MSLRERHILPPSQLQAYNPQNWCILEKWLERVVLVVGDVVSESYNYCTWYYMQYHLTLYTFFILFHPRIPLQWCRPGPRLAQSTSYLANIAVGATLSGLESDYSDERSEFVARFCWEHWSVGAELCWYCLSIFKISPCVYTSSHILPLITLISRNLRVFRWLWEPCNSICVVLTGATPCETLAMEQSTITICPDRNTHRSILKMVKDIRV